VPSSEFIAPNRPTPPSAKTAAAPRVQPYPCANCGRQVISRTTRRVYCSDLCSQVAKWIRYFQKTVVDGRCWFPDVHEALSVRLGHIASGGYAETERRLSVELREAVRMRAGGRCQICGDTGTDVDHIRGSSADPSNLQLLCRRCHSLKTQGSMRPAEQDVLETVHKPIQRRAFEIPHRQPCDSVEWQHRLWAKGAGEVSSDTRSTWLAWTDGAGLEPLSPAKAVAGFPPELDPWAWYLGERPEVGSFPSHDTWYALLEEHGDGWSPPDVEPLIDFDDESMTAAAFMETFGGDIRRLSEYMEKVEKDIYEQLERDRYEQKRRAEELANKPVINSRPFWEPITGKGKWHTSYADVPGCVMPPWVRDPQRSPACGSRTVELEPTSEPFYTTVGERRSKYADRLCGNCVRIE